MRIAVLGSGAMGTACAVLLANRGCDVALWGRDAGHVAEILRNRENRRLLPGVGLPGRVSIHSDAREASADSCGIIVATPTRYLRETLKRVARDVPPGVTAVSVVKGIENESFARPSEIILDEIGPRPVVALSGPCHAEEAVRNLPASLVAASDDLESAKFVQDLFTSDRFRIYTNGDLLGVELAGALKNVMAIAAGISDGLGYGDNAKAALMTRGIVEMTRFGIKMGAQPATFQGLAGIGDLITTCVSPHGRNRRVGERLGRGESLESITTSMNGVAEGVTTCASVMGIARERGIEMPIAAEVFGVLFEGRSPAEATDRLMTRPAREEST